MNLAPSPRPRKFPRTLPLDIYQRLCSGFSLLILLLIKVQKNLPPEAKLSGKWPALLVLGLSGGLVAAVVPGRNANDLHQGD